MKIKRYDRTGCADLSGIFVKHSDYATLEAKCAALAAELSQAKSVVSECREYFIAGIMNRIRPTNEGYLHMRCDTLGDETTSHDAFLAEVLATSLEDFADVMAEAGHYDTANYATNHAHKIRQEEAQ